MEQPWHCGLSAVPRDLHRMILKKESTEPTCFPVARFSTPNDVLPFNQQMDEEARKHLEMTLAGKERPVPAFFTKYITGTYGMDSFPPCVVQEASQW